MTTPIKPRGRELGILFDGAPGTYNAITDVPFVEVGHATLISGRGKLLVGKGPVRTGVTAIFPLGKKASEGVLASWFPLNGVGEMTGTALIDEHGGLYGPILITNTLSVGSVRDAAIQWSMARLTDRKVLFSRSLPVVAETWDGYLNDIYGFHVHQEHVFAALDGAESGPVPEGNVGGGTGMIAYFFKGGIGTASRVVELAGTSFNVGVLVQANHGMRSDLQVLGVPLGREISDFMPSAPMEVPLGSSIIIVIATDAPLLPYQLRRLAKRAALGLARAGGSGNNTSGDIMLAFSTSNTVHPGATGLQSYHSVSNNQIDALFEATIQATEESILNALLAAGTMEGADGHIVHALPHDRLQEVMRKYYRLAE